MMNLLLAQATQEASQVVDNFTPEKHVYAAYAIVTVLLWGYIVLVLLKQRHLRRHLQDMRADGSAAP